jgi:hypothetical protein
MSAATRAVLVPLASRFARQALRIGGPSGGVPVRMWYDNCRALRLFFVVP